MKANMCNIERVIRAVIGIVLIGGSITGLIGVWGWVGIIPLATAAFSFCPAYAVLGINTCNAGGANKKATLP